MNLSYPHTSGTRVSGKCRGRNTTGQDWTTIRSVRLLSEVVPGRATCGMVAQRIRTGSFCVSLLQSYFIACSSNSNCNGSAVCGWCSSGSASSNSHPQLSLHSRQRETLSFKTSRDWNVHRTQWVFRLHHGVYRQWSTDGGVVPIKLPYKQQISKATPPNSQFAQYYRPGVISMRGIKA